MQDSLFTRIIKDEIPCHKIHETEQTLAFLDVFPIQPGHTLVISKRQVENFHELDGEEYDELWRTVHKVARRLNEMYPDKAKIGIQVEGLDVPHVHVKVFPFNTPEEFRHVPDFTAEINHTELAELAARLRF